MVNCTESCPNRLAGCIQGHERFLISASISRACNSAKVGKTKNLIICKAVSGVRTLVVRMLRPDETDIQLCPVEHSNSV